jgi:hypothetical protein
MAIIVQRDFHLEFPPLGGTLTIVPKSITGSALALLGLVSFIGAFSSPIVAGLLIEGTERYIPVFGYAALTAVAGVVLAKFAAEPPPQGWPHAHATSTSKGDGRRPTPERGL